MGKVSKNVCAKFRCAPLRIKKALAIFGPGRTDNNNKKKKNRVVFWDPPSGSNNCQSMHVDTLSACPVVAVSSPQSDRSFTTNCLRASGIIRKQLVQIDTVMHPPSSTAPADESQRSGTVAITPRY